MRLSFRSLKNLKGGFVKSTRNKQILDRTLSELSRLDVWDAEEIGIEIPPYSRAKTLNFEKIKQVWLKKLGKRYLQLYLMQKSFNSLRMILASLIIFSEFIEEKVPSSSPALLDRSVIQEFLTWVKKKNWSAATQQQRLILLKGFFQTIHEHEWADIPPYLFRDCDLPRVTKALPRYIPEEVLKQLEAYLSKLPAPIERATKVLLETGLRVGEVAELKKDCLKQDSSGAWFLHYRSRKIGREFSKPISVTLAGTIQEQFQYINAEFGDKF